MRDFTIEDNDGNEVTLPTRWAICPECDGHGKSSAYLGAITADDRERDWSEEEFDEYLRGGYDRRCDACEGSGKVKEVDWRRLSNAEREVWRAKCEEEAAYRAECRLERMMGC